MIDEKKFDRQLVAITNWRTNKGVGTWHWVTGMGKTFAAVHLIKLVLSKRLLTVNIILPNEELADQWRAEIREHIKDEDYIMCINLYTIHSLLVNNLRPTCELLIVDELHLFYATESCLAIRELAPHAKFRLGLTATYYDDGREKLLSDLFPIVDTISRDEAEAEGYISNYIEYNLALELKPEERLEYNRLSNIITDNLSKFPSKEGLQIAQRCLSGDFKYKLKPYDYAIQYSLKMGWTKGDPNTDMWNPNKVIGYASMLMGAVKQRKDLLYNCEAKLVTVVALLRKFKHLKTICFSESTGFADAVAFNYGDTDIVVYHTKLETKYLPVGKNGTMKKVGLAKQKTIAIDRIKSGDARVISTASALDKGFNVPDIEMAITASGTQNPIQYIQRSGRALRVNPYNPTGTALLINLYVQDTKDEGWLRRRQEYKTGKMLWVDSIDDIKLK